MFGTIADVHFANVMFDRPSCLAGSIA